MRKTMLALALAALAGSAQAGPTYQFITSTGVQPGNVGTIEIEQVNATTVRVLVDLFDTNLPNPRYGFMNTGGPHSPFAFNILNGGALSASFIQPLNGAFSFGLLSLSGPGDATPFGTFGVTIADSAGNGSGVAYYGDLEFDLTRASGLSTDDFVSNGSAYFAADLTNGTSNTGSQAWSVRSACTGDDCPVIVPVSVVPEPGTLALLGASALGLALRRKS
jgi:hypothetical protein